MSKAEKGRLYAPPEQGNRMDNWNENTEKGGGNKDPKKLKKRRESHGGRSFVLDKMKKEGRGEYKEV